MKHNFVLSLFIFVSTITTTIGQTILKGELPKGEEVILYMNDVYGNELPPITITNKEEKLNITCETILFEANELQTPFIVYPNEYITVRKKKNTILEIKANPTRNYELDFFNKLINEQGVVYGFREAKRYSKISKFSILDSTIETIKSKRIAFLELYCKNYNLRHDFKYSVNNYLKYMAIYYKLYGLYKNLKQGYQISEVNKFLLEKMFQQDELVCKNQFYRAGAFLLNVLISKDSIGKNSEAIGQYNNATKYFEGYTRDYIIYRILKQSIDTFSVEMQPFYEKFTEKSSYTNLANAIIEDLELRSVTNNSKAGLIKTDNNSQVTIESLLNNKDSIVYVDFWATWCMPCIKEMTYSENLQLNYLGKKIKFIYVAMDKSKSAWTNYSNNHSHLRKSNNSFLLIENFTSVFAKKNKIITIPRYMLIGKNGKIISTNAPRPSDPKLKTLIEKYINQ